MGIQPAQEWYLGLYVFAAVNPHPYIDHDNKYHRIRSWY